MSITQPTINARRGDVDHAYGFKAQPFPKKVGVAGSGDHKIAKGLILAKDPTDTTKNLFMIAPANAVKPFIVSRGTIFNPSSEAIDNYLLTDAQGEYISALETDTVISCVYAGEVIVEFAETVQVGDPVMAQATTGKAINWDGADEDTICGYYRGRPGYRTGEFPPGQVTTGQIGWMEISHI